MVTFGELLLEVLLPLVHGRRPVELSTRSGSAPSRRSWRPPRRRDCRSPAGRTSTPPGQRSCRGPTIPYLPPKQSSAARLPPPIYAPPPTGVADTIQEAADALQWGARERQQRPATPAGDLPHHLHRLRRRERRASTAQGQRRIVDYLIAAGTHGLAATGGASESGKMTLGRAARLARALRRADRRPGAPDHGLHRREHRRERRPRPPRRRAGRTGRPSASSRSRAGPEGRGPRRGPASGTT